MPPFPPTLTINDKKRDCTACRKTLQPGIIILKTFTKKNKPAGYFCKDAHNFNYVAEQQHG